MSTSRLKLIALAAAVATATGCSDSEEEAVAAILTDQSITVNFAAKVADQDFNDNCTGKYATVGTGTGSGDEYKIEDYRMYIYDVHVHDPILGELDVELDQDGQWQHDNVALLDFESAHDATNPASDPASECTGTYETNTRIVGTVDADVDLTDTQICFEVGVPFQYNHLDKDAASTPSPLNAPGMMWVWKNGHKFIRVDGFGDPDGANEKFVLHLGSQGDCQMQVMSDPNSPPSAACSVPNTFEACISNFNVDTDSITVDVADVFAANDVSTNLGGVNNKPGCQSFPGDDDCAEVFPRLGLEYSTSNYGNATFNSMAPKQQMLFSK